MREDFIRGENLSISIVSDRQLDEKFCFNFLLELPKKAGLTPYANPQIHFFPNTQVVSENGISGTMMMIESHCAFHWWPEKSFTSVTVSSCKEILEKSVIDWLKEIFGTNKVFWVKTLWPSN